MKTDILKKRKFESIVQIVFSKPRLININDTIIYINRNINICYEFI